MTIHTSILPKDSEAWVAGSEAWLSGSEACLAGSEPCLAGFWALGGRVNERTNERTENLPILQDFVPYRGRCPKRERHLQENGKFSKCKVSSKS